VFAPEDGAAFSRFLCQDMLTDPYRPPRQRAVEHFSWERYRDRLLAAYRRAAAAKGL
jgi:glycosyltransferase involved in cell wall biosynthesis